MDSANTYVSVLRGTAENAFGDTVDSDQAAFTHVPAIIAETGRTIQDPSTPEPRTIRDIVCHVPWWTGVLNSDRIVDECTDDTYIILGVTRPSTLAGAPVDLMLQMKRITAVTA